MTSNNFCFQSDSDNICFSMTPLAQNEPLTTTLSLSDIRNGISNAASTVGNFIQQNALPIGLSLGVAAALGLGIGGTALALNNSGSGAPAMGPSFGSILQQINFGNLSPQEQRLVDIGLFPLVTNSGNPSTNAMPIQQTCLPRYYTVTM